MLTNENSMYASKNFDKRELKCTCCGQYVIDDFALETLQKARDILGAPIIVNSAYRCVRYNDQINASKNSYHLLGRAFDLRAMSAYYRYSLFRACIEAGFRGFKVYPYHIHVDTRSVSPGVILI